MFQAVSFISTQEMCKPEVPKTLRLRLDSTLSLQSRKRYVSVKPSDVEESRNNLDILANMWFLAQLRKPSCNLYLDLSKNRWTDFLRELVTEDNFLFEREMNGTRGAALSSSLEVLREVRIRSRLVFCTWILFFFLLPRHGHMCSSVTLQVNSG